MLFCYLLQEGKKKNNRESLKVVVYYFHTTLIIVPLWQQNFILVGVHACFLGPLQNRIDLRKNL